MSKSKDTTGTQRLTEELLLPNCLSTIYVFVRQFPVQRSHIVLPLPLPPIHSRIYCTKHAKLPARTLLYSYSKRLGCEIERKNNSPTLLINAMKRLLSLRHMIPPKRFYISSRSRVLRRFRCVPTFLKHLYYELYSAFVSVSLCHCTGHM